MAERLKNIYIKYFGLLIGVLLFFLVLVIGQLAFNRSGLAGSVDQTSFMYALAAVDFFAIVLIYAVRSHGSRVLVARLFRGKFSFSKKSVPRLVTAQALDDGLSSVKSEIVSLGQKIEAVSKATVAPVQAGKPKTKAELAKELECERLQLGIDSLKRLAEEVKSGKRKVVPDVNLLTKQEPDVTLKLVTLQEKSVEDDKPVADPPAAAAPVEAKPEEKKDQAEQVKMFI